MDMEARVHAARHRDAAPHAVGISVEHVEPSAQTKQVDKPPLAPPAPAALSPPRPVSAGSSSARQSTLSSLSSSAQSMVEGVATRSGYLRMRVATREWTMKTWYCCLIRTHLYWYSSKHDAVRGQHLQGRVAVIGARTSDGHGMLHTYKNAFTFESERGEVFFCAASTEQDRDEWIKMLNAAGNYRILRRIQDNSSTQSTSSCSSRSTEGDGRDAMPSGLADPSTDPRASWLRRSRNSRDISDWNMANQLGQQSAESSHSCNACGVQFGFLWSQKRVCKCCGRAFCKVHCSKHEVITDQHGGTTEQRSRVCDDCSYRQNLVTVVVSITSQVIGMIKQGTDGVAAVQRAWESSIDPAERAKMIEELAVVVMNPASYSVLSLLCLLKKYMETPWMFVRVLCLMIPLYETARASLEEYWVQLLALFLPLLRSREPFGLPTQFYMRFVYSVCRRSTAFALRTMWEALAMYEDARAQGDSASMSFLQLFLYSACSFEGNSAFVAANLLEGAPSHQAEAILDAMDGFLQVRAILRGVLLDNLSARWFNAVCSHEIADARGLVLQALSIHQEADSVHPLLTLLDPIETNYCETLHELGHIPSVEWFRETRCSICDPNDATSRRAEREFDAQAKFVAELTQISERLRHVTPVTSRSEQLVELLSELQRRHFGQEQQPADTTALCLPLWDAGRDPRQQCVLRILPHESKVFSTRVRAPTMVVFESGRNMHAAAEDEGKDVATNGSREDGFAAKADRDEARIARFKWMRASRTSSLAILDSFLLDEILTGDRTGDRTNELIGSESDSASASAVSTPPSSKTEESPLELHHSESEIDSTSGSQPSNSPPETLLMDDARDCFERRANPTILETFSPISEASTEAERPLLDRASSTWAAKCQLIKEESSYGHLDGWAVASVIAKSFDDLRQEVFAMQLMGMLQDIFVGNGLTELYLRPYRILCTGANEGLIETLTDALSIDAIKKRRGSLWKYFTELFGESDSPVFHRAQHAFASSMAASSLYCYLFQVKDRHNGNIMMDRRGHVLHIDFGFLLGIAPGGSFSLEDAPFKLTLEMVELMGGQGSVAFAAFQQLFIDGFLAVRQEYVKLVSLLHLTADRAPFPCFQQQSPDRVLRRFRRRLFLHDPDDAVVPKIRRLIDKSLNHWGTRQYDKFQLASNGILP